jgi:uncharacterized membrane protein YdbT with pleckstrin-like domain
MDTKTIVLRPTWSFAIWSNFKYFLLLLVVLNLAFIFKKNYLFLLGLIPILIALYKIAYWRNVEYEVSKTQVIYKRGVLGRKVDYLELYRVKDFEQRQSLFMRMINIMDLKLITSDKNNPVLLFKGIPYSNMAVVIRELVERARVTGRVFEVD